MADTDFQIGDIIEIVPGLHGGCSNLTDDIRDGKARYVKVLVIDSVGNPNSYEVLDKDMKRVKQGRMNWGVCTHCCYLPKNAWQKVKSAKQNLMGKLNTLAKKLVDADI